MDKTISEILESVATSTIEWDDGTKYFQKENVYEAMKIWGEQCFEAGKKTGFDDCRSAGHTDIQPEDYDDYQTYINKLEEKK